MAAGNRLLSDVGSYMAVRAMICCVLCLFCPPAMALDQTRLVQTRLAQSQSREVFFSIESQPLRAALLEFSKQSGIQLIYVAETQPPLQSPPLTGRYSIRQALEILLQDSGFEYEFSEGDTVTIRNIFADTASVPHKRKGDMNYISASGQDENDSQFPEFEEIISIGSRARGRTALKTLVPVDVMTAQKMRSTGETETGRILQFLAPSFNFSSSSISDGTDAIKPATLRGLGPDQTLVLINGRRRHTSALVHVNTSVGRGTTGVDLGAIPPGAIRRIEILRDGASAQYGSDAIAGVINIILKDQQDGGEISGSYGQTYAGDGDIFVANASYGLPLSKDGWLTLSAEYRDKSRTNRAGPTGCLQFALGGQKACAAGNIAIDPREADFERQNFRIGDSDTEQKTLIMNMGLPLTEKAELYMFATYSNRDNQSAGFYRRANEYTRTVIELYPEGFLPKINTEIKDHSILGGARWSSDNGWSLDGSVTTGGNDFQFIISNSLNASFGADSPTSADAGTLKIRQTMVNIDIAKSFDIANIAFGAEWRNEKYQIIAGEPVSYADGGALNRNCPGCDINPIPYAPGFQVFRGFSQANAVNESRDSLALYTDIELEINADLLLNAAVRFEDYSDFGSRINAKFAGRYQISDHIAVRGSVSSGFRAPSMQQRFFNSTSTQFVEVNGQTIAQERGTFRNDSEVAQTLIIPELKIETAINYSLGFVANPLKNLTFTADYYRIDIDDRIAISGSIPISDKFPAVTAATGATDGQFFTNLANTKTQGVDIVIGYQIPLPKTQRLHLSLAANKTETRIKPGSIASPLVGVDSITLFNLQDRSIIEDWQPSSRINFTVDYAIRGWSFILRNNLYGSYEVCEGSCDIASGSGQNIQKFSAKLLTDIQISYNFQKARLRLSAGANNLFNVFPDINIIGQSRGGSIDGIIDSPGVFKYSRRSAPFGHNGGYYYLRIAKSF